MVNNFISTFRIILSFMYSLILTNNYYGRASESSLIQAEDEIPKMRGLVVMIVMCLRRVELRLHIA